MTYNKYKIPYTNFGGSLKKDFLVIVPAGDKSYHTSWYDSQIFDLLVIYFGNNPKKKLDYKQKADFFIKKKGPKWQLIRYVLTVFFEKQFNWKQYKYIWLPDDDLKISRNNVEEFLLTSQKLKLKLSQPSLRPPHLSIKDQVQIIKDWNNLNNKSKKYIGWRKYYKQNRNKNTDLINNYISYKLLLQNFLKKKKNSQIY